jgi:hypothetical protein
MKRPAGRRALPFAALLASTLLFAGCLSVESNLTINDDGTVDVQLSTAIDTEQLGRIGGLLGEDTNVLEGLGGDELLSQLTDGQNPCGDLTGALTDYEATTDEISDGSEVGVSCTVEGVPIEDLTSIGGGSSITIEQDDAGTRLSAQLEGLDQLTTGLGDLGDIPGGTDAITELLGIDLDELFTITFNVTGPGTLGDNNATSTDGATATWDITADSSFIADGTATLTAEWTPGGGSGSSTWIILAVIAAIIVIAAIVAAIVIGKRRSGPAATDAAGDAGTVPTGPPTAPLTGAPPPPPPAAPPTVESPPAPADDPTATSAPVGPQDPPPAFPPPSA